MAKAAQNKAIQAAVAAARRRGKKAIERILTDPGMLTGDEIAKLLGVATATVEDKLKKRELLGLKLQDHVVRYPHWQLDNRRRPAEGLADILAKFGDDSWTAYRFLTQYHAGLGRKTAIDALKAGQKNAVLRVADSAIALEFS